MSDPITYAELDRFTQRLGKEDYTNRLNYFRWMEYPLTLNMMDAKPGMRVLEVGAGLLSLPSLFLAAERGCNVVAIDLRDYDDKARHYIAQLREKLGISRQQLQVRTMNAMGVDFDDGTFDIVSAISMIEHLPSFVDGRVAKELGRVVKVGGKMILSVPFNLGDHIENEKWGGEEYEQRHYNEFTLRERLITPTSMHFVRAVAFGEVKKGQGAQYCDWDRERQVQFCMENMDKSEDFWTEYYRVENSEEFMIHRPHLPREILEKAGVIAVELEKREKPPQRTYFNYDPLESYRQNQRLTKTAGNWPDFVEFDEIIIKNFWGHEQTVFESGETMNLSVAFRCQGNVTEPCIRIFFHDEKGDLVAGFCTADAGYRFGTMSGPYRIDIQFGMMNLLPGRYSVTVGAWEWVRPNPIAPYAYQVLENITQIEIRQRLPGLSGKAYLPYEFHLESLKCQK